MSWLFSQALVAEYSADTCSDGESSAPSNGLPTQLAYLSHGKTTGFSRLSQFGMTCRPLTDDRGEALLMSYLAASRARTSARPVGGQALKAPALECGSTWPALSVRFDPVESKWKTAHCLWEEDLPWSSVTLPPWGMTRNGFVFRHPTAERPISATVCGLWPTPNAMPATNSLDFCCSGDGRTKPNKLGWAVAEATWPTPNARDYKGAPGAGCVERGGRQSSLPQAVKTRTWPTHVTSMAKGSSPASLTRKDGQNRSNDRLDHAVMASGGGQLNPTWVEWLMGWPLGWTDLKPLGMDRFREWQRQHSPCWKEAKAA